MTGTQEAINVLEIQTPTKTKWQKFVAVLSCCWQVTAPIMNGAISLGVDAASNALREQIGNDGTLNDAQKRALSALTEKGIKGITGAVKAKIDAQAQQHVGEVDPSLVAAGTAVVSGAIALGAVEAVSPELAARVKTSAAAPLDHPVITRGKLKAIAKQLTTTKTAMLDLPADHALILKDEVLKNIVTETIRASGLPKANQDALIKTGAALAFITNYIEASNEVHQAAVAAIHSSAVEAAAAPIVPAAISAANALLDPASASLEVASVLRVAAAAPIVPAAISAANALLDPASAYLDFVAHVPIQDTLGVTAVASQDIHVQVSGDSHASDS